ncbi:carboxypeptidase regulatory-like domain-containing protein [Microbacterium sp. NPDC055988]|uniref:carboxypeptidase regulatory-like domain-containing protein n=1 Tax=Microbacterium sp. NPDC055988 TaxID=3345671 RepID=UPI0035D67E68
MLRSGGVLLTALALIASSAVPAVAAEWVPAAPTLITAAAPDLVSDDPAVVSAAHGAQISTQLGDVSSRDAASDDASSRDAPATQTRTAAAATAEAGPPESSYGEVVTVTVSGRFVTPAGAAARGVNLTAQAMYGDDSGILATYTTGASGTFTMKVETARPFRLIVRPGSGHVGGTISSGGTLIPGTGYQEGQWSLEPVATTSTLGDITLVAGHVVSGSVTVTGPLSQTDAQLELASATALFDMPLAIQTGETKWSLTVPAGTYEAAVHAYGVGISAYHGGTTSETATSIVVRGSVTGIGIGATVSSRTISGTVRDAGGNPVEGASVSIAPQPWAGENSGRSAVSGADGRYTLVNVVPGSYNLAFFAGGPSVYWPGVDDWESAGIITINAATPSLSGYDAVTKAGVMITGTSTDTDGTPRAGDVVHFSRGSTEYGSVTTRADGTYTSYALPVGDYTVSLTQGGYSGTVQQWYDGKRSAAEADLVRATTDGTVCDGIDFVAVKGGSITGTVSFANGTAVKGATVSVFAAHDTYQPVATATTDAQGRYTVKGLNRENYVVEITSGTSGVADVWYGATANDPAAAVIELGLDATFRADVTAVLGGTISGTLTPAIAGETYWLTLTRQDGSAQRSLAVSTTDGSAVQWKVSGLTGTWIAWVDDVYWNGDGSPDGFTPITVVPGEVFGGVDFDLRKDLNVTGALRTTDGSEIARVDVTIERQDGEWWNYVDSSNATGVQFGFAVEPGVYRVRTAGYSPNGDALRETTTPITVVAGKQTVLDITTQRGWTVSGRLTDAATGEPVFGASVRAQSPDSYAYAYGMTQSDGTYRVVVGSPGAWDVVAAEDSAIYSAATRRVTVAGADLKDITFALAKGQRLSGRVTGENTTNPLPGIQVDVWNADEEIVASATTAADGTYRTPALADGTYTVRFVNWSGLYVEEWWKDATTSASATKISVAGKPVTAVDASMRLGGVIIGSVLDADGNALAGATVGLATLPATGLGAVFAPLTQMFGATPGGTILDVETTTDADGTYTLPPVEAGTYGLYVYSPATGTTWFDGKKTLSEADAVEVSAGGTLSVPLQLRALAAGEDPRTPEQSISDEFTIQRQPADVSVTDGETATFRATASGATAPTIRWEKRKPGASTFTAIAGATDTTLAFTGTVADSGTGFRAVFTSGGTTKTTDIATLTVKAKPTVPKAPTVPVASKLQPTAAQLDWTAPDSGGSPVTGYSVRIYTGGQLVREVAVTGQSFSLTGLTAQTTYAASVTAINAVGSSAESPRVSFTTPKPLTVPGAPTAVSVVPGDGQVVVSWTAPTANGGSAITGYTVTASPGGAKVTTTGATTATVTGLTNGTAYKFLVTATNAVGTSVPSAVSATVTPLAPPKAPGAPTAVTAVAGNGQATVSWKAPTSNGGSAITGYAVTAQPGGKTVTTTGATTATVTGLANGTAYTFTVKATNAVGYSPTSAASSAVTPAAAAAVSRQSGPGRYETAVAVSVASFPTAGVPVVYLANGRDFPDALAGAAAAGHFGGPVLLTEPGALPPVVAAELARLKPQKIVILGGTGVVTDAVKKQAEAYIKR